MLTGGARPGSGRKKKDVEEGPVFPKRGRGRLSNVEKAERARIEAEWLAARAAAAQAEAAVQAPEAPAPAAAAPVVLKPTAYTPEMPADVSPKDYFLILMRDPRVAPERRDRAAQVAISYTEAKPDAAKAKLGKKEQQQLDAEAVATGGGKFGAGRPPLSVVGNGA